jgi:hypothetical protein
MEGLHPNLKSPLSISLQRTMALTFSKTTITAAHLTQNIPSQAAALPAVSRLSIHTMTSLISTSLPQISLRLTRRQIWTLLKARVERSLR